MSLRDLKRIRYWVLSRGNAPLQCRTIKKASRIAHGIGGEKYDIALIRFFYKNGKKMSQELYWKVKHVTS